MNLFMLHNNGVFREYINIMFLFLVRDKACFQR